VSEKQGIMGIFVAQEGKVLSAGVPIILACSEEEQEQLATEFARFMHGWVHKLANGVIFVVDK